MDRQVHHMTRLIDDPLDVSRSSPVAGSSSAQGRVDLGTTVNIVAAAL
jgi:hypothetical protein